MNGTTQAGDPPAVVSPARRMAVLDRRSPCGDLIVSHRSQLLAILTLVAALALLVIGFLVWGSDSPDSGGTPQASPPRHPRPQCSRRPHGKFDFNAAVAAFEPLLAKYPSWRTARINLGIARLNRGNKSKDDLAKALRTMLEVKKQDPQTCAPGIVPA